MLSPENHWSCDQFIVTPSARTGTGEQVATKVIIERALETDYEDEIIEAASRLRAAAIALSSVDTDARRALLTNYAELGNQLSVGYFKLLRGRAEFRAAHATLTYLVVRAAGEFARFADDYHWYLPLIENWLATFSEPVDHQDDGTSPFAVTRSALSRAVGFNDSALTALLGTFGVEPDQRGLVTPFGERSFSLNPLFCALDFDVARLIRLIDTGLLPPITENVFVFRNNSASPATAGPIPMGILGAYTASGMTLAAIHKWDDGWRVVRRADHTVAEHYFTSGLPAVTTSSDIAVTLGAPRA